MFSSAQLSIGNPGRWICDFFWSLWRISCEFTFRPLCLLTDVYTYGWLFIVPASDSALLVTVSCTGPMPMRWNNIVSVVLHSESVGLQLHAHECPIGIPHCSWKETRQSLQTLSSTSHPIKIYGLISLKKTHYFRQINMAFGKREAVSHN